MNAIESREGTSAPPVDMATMRASVAEVLPPDVTPTDRGTLQTLTWDDLLVRRYVNRDCSFEELERASWLAPLGDATRLVASRVSFGAATAPPRASTPRPSGP